MKTKIIIAIALATIIATGFLLSSGDGKSKQVVATPAIRKPEQVIILLDLSDRITQPGQMESDKKLIQKVFQEFFKNVRYNLVMNSKDRFQICIAPQRNQSFDKDVESDNLTLDLSNIKTAEKLNKIKYFEAEINEKVDVLYKKAFKGNQKQNYEGSNIWQFFNETLPTLTNDKMDTKLIVLTDGYFDFEQNNPQLNNGNLSTTTNFINKVRQTNNWKGEIVKNGYGILPVNQPFINLSVCVSEIRSKNESNLNEPEMLKHVWSNWLISNGIKKLNFKTIAHSSISNTSSQLTDFFRKTN